jgi:glucans biosynthesis protein C
MFPQYLILFSLGAAAGRRGWLETLTPELQRRCGLAAALTALAMPVILVMGDFFEGGAAKDRFAGGWHWQAAAASFTEGVLATCVSLWAIGYIRDHHDRQRPFARRMALAAYGAFLVHPPVLVGLALAVQRLPVPAEGRFVCVLSAGVAASFGLAALGAERTGRLRGRRVLHDSRSARGR